MLARAWVFQQNTFISCLPSLCNWGPYFRRSGLLFLIGKMGITIIKFSRIVMMNRKEN
jgi:hypothetical protein